MENSTPNTDEEEPAKEATRCHLAGFRGNPRIHPDHDYAYIGPILVVVEARDLMALTKMLPGRTVDTGSIKSQARKGAA